MGRSFGGKKNRRNEDPLEFYCTNYCKLDYLDMKWSPGYEEEEDDSNWNTRYHEPGYYSGHFQNGGCHLAPYLACGWSAGGCLRELRWTAGARIVWAQPCHGNGTLSNKHVWGMPTHPTDRSKVDTSEEERVMVKRHFEQDF